MADGLGQTYSDPEQVGVALSEAIAAGDWRLFFLQRDRARKATLAEVQRAAPTYFVRRNSVEGYVDQSSLWGVYPGERIE